MSQTFTDDWYAQSYNAATAFGNAEANDVALKSQFSGGSAPSNAVAGMPWYHTSKGLRVRDAANAAWLKTLQGDASSKTWFYRNDTAEGWIIDTGVTDKVIAIKGGSAAWNVNGGTSGGSHTITGLAAANESTHTHPINSDSHSHGIGTPTTSGTGYRQDGGNPGGGEVDPVYVYTSTGTAGDTATATGAGAAHNHAISHDGSSRIAAAVGTLQMPDLS